MGVETSNIEVILNQFEAEVVVGGGYLFRTGCHVPSRRRSPSTATGWILSEKNGFSMETRGFDNSLMALTLSPRKKKAFASDCTNYRFPHGINAYWRFAFVTAVFCIIKSVFNPYSPDFTRLSHSTPKSVHIILLHYSIPLFVS